MANNDRIIFGALALTLIVLLSLSVISSSSSSDADERDGFFMDDIYYEIIGSEVTVHHRASTTPDIIIPKTAVDPTTHKEYAVAAMETMAFSGDQNLVNVDFETGCGITSIAEFGFDDCPLLEKVHLEKLAHLQRIEKDAFSDSALMEIYIPSTVEYIDDFAFEGCRFLKTVTFGPDSRLDTMMNETFAGCISLETIDLPSCLRYIGPSAFNGCTSLRSVSFGEGSLLETIGQATFLECDSLTDIYFPKFTEFESMGEAAFGYVKGGLVYDYDFANTLGGEKFVLPGSDVKLFEGNRYHREAGSTTFTKAFDVTFQGYGTKVAYAGTTVDRPSVPERPGMVLTEGEYDGKMWNFGKDIVDKDITLVPKWAIVQEGYTVVEADREVEISPSQGLDAVTVLFSNGKTVSVEIPGHEGSLHVSSYDLSGNKFEIVTEWSDGSKFSGNILVSVPIDEKAGIPTVYLYEGKEKTAMQTTVIEGTAYFITDHNSTFGIEYEEAPASSGSGPWGYVVIALALVTLVAFVALVAMRRD